MWSQLIVTKERSSNGKSLRRPTYYLYTYIIAFQTVDENNLFLVPTTKGTKENIVQVRFYFIIFFYGLQKHLKSILACAKQKAFFKRKTNTCFLNADKANSTTRFSPMSTTTFLDRRNNVMDISWVKYIRSFERRNTSWKSIADLLKYFL